MAGDSKPNEQDKDTTDGDYEASQIEYANDMFLRQFYHFI